MNTWQLIHAESTPPQAWRNGGGQTRELLAWPSAADWTLRISRADIETSGPFSAFAGVQRWFVVLHGRGVVLHLPTADGSIHTHQLQPGDAPLQFDGALAPGCTLVNGPTQDLNLMARGGKAVLVAALPNTNWLPTHAMCGLYTACAGTWHCGAQALALQPHALLWLEGGSDAAMRFAPDNADKASAWWLGYTPEMHV